MQNKWIPGPDGDYIRNQLYGKPEPIVEVATPQVITPPVIIPPVITPPVIAPIKIAKRTKSSTRSKQIIAVRNWPNIRKAILERDNYSCRICHKDGAEVSLNVHHIDWILTHNTPSNLVTLCPTCHKAVHTKGYKPGDHPFHPLPWGELERFQPASSLRSLLFTHLTAQKLRS